MVAKKPRKPRSEYKTEKGRKHPGLGRLHRIKRSERDGTKVVRTWFFPTEKEHAEAKAMAEHYGISLSELITEGICRFRQDKCPVTIFLKVEDLAVGRKLAKECGMSIKEWIEAGVVESIKIQSGQEVFVESDA